jgi:small GTP-binding protein
VLIQIWDTAGQEKFRTITPSYYRSAMGIVLVYSADDKESFNSITVWIKQIKNFLNEGIPIILVCNKSELQKKQVS